MKRVDYNYKVGNKVILNNKSSHKYETSYKGTFEITQCFNNGTVSLQMSVKKYDTIYITLRPINIKPTLMNSIHR